MYFFSASISLKVNFFPFQECLDERQVRALEDYQRSLQERKCAELQSKFERVWKEQEEEQVTQQLSLLLNLWQVRSMMSVDHS